jgi:hypothetical protein
MGRPLLQDAQPNNISWVDYWIDNTNYCAYFGCDDDQYYENSVLTGTGCCVGTNFLGNIKNNNNKNNLRSISTNGCTTSLSPSFRMSSTCGGADVTDNDDLSNFATQHDAFLDSLLHEQQQQLLYRSKSPVNVNVNNCNINVIDDDDVRTSDSVNGGVGLNTSAISLATTHSWTLSPTSSNDSLSDNGGMGNNSASRKRRRGLLLVATPRVSQQLATTTNPASSVSVQPQSERPLCNNSSSSSGNRSLPPLHSSSGSGNGNIIKATPNALLTSSSYSNTSDVPPSPESFLHPNVRLQKDKGKGSDVGSVICAKGIPDCVGKLRQKMQLLTEHCSVQPNHNGTTTIATTSGAVASMKRRNAIIAERHTNFIETRSLLTLRMGFLSMTYGILLRWDIGKTGLVTLVVLRKNSHESFYRTLIKSKSAPMLPSTTHTLQRSATNNSVSPSSSMDYDDDDGDNIVRLNQPPFLVPRPTQFTPSEITISVLYATGLSKKSHWTVQLQLGDQIENILLSYDGTTMIPKLGGPLHYILTSTNTNMKVSPTIVSGNMDAVLEIRLLEHKVRRKTRVLRCSMVLPLYSLEAVGSISTTTTTPSSTQLRIPCPDGAAIQLEATLVSDEAIWQREELLARQQKQHEQRSKWWKPTTTTTTNTTTSNNGSGTSKSSIAVINNDTNDDHHSSWDWLFCTLC